MPEFACEFLDGNGETQIVPKLPSKKRIQDAGYDVYSAEEGVVPAHGHHNFNTGIRLSVPEGWFYSVRGRSGLGFKNVQPFIGTIDATYNGHLRILLLNFGDKPLQVKVGDRIAQLIFEEQIEMRPKLVESFSEDYDLRGQAGFGSSGR